MGGNPPVTFNDNRYLVMGGNPPDTFNENRYPVMRGNPPITFNDNQHPAWMYPHSHSEFVFVLSVILFNTPRFCMLDIE